MAKLETVKIEADSESGFIIINKSDLTEKHTLFDGKKKEKAKDKPKREKAE